MEVVHNDFGLSKEELERDMAVRNAIANIWKHRRPSCISEDHHTLMPHPLMITQ